MRYILILGLLLGGTPGVWGHDLLTLQITQFEWKENCLASRSFAGKLEEEMQMKASAQKELLEIQKNSEAVLLKCSGKVGVSHLTSEQDMQKAITACPNEYEEWAKATPSQMLLRVELKELSSQLSRIKRYIQNVCLAMN